MLTVEFARYKRHLYRLQISQMGLTFCDIRKNVANIILIYDLLNGLIDSSGITGYDRLQYNYNGCLKKSKLFHIPFYIFISVLHNYNSTFCSIDPDVNMIFFRYWSTIDCDHRIYYYMFTISHRSELEFPRYV